MFRSHQSAVKSGHDQLSSNMHNSDKISAGCDNPSFASDRNDTVIELYKCEKNGDSFTVSRPPTRQSRNIAEPVSLSWHNIDVFSKPSSSKLSCLPCKKNNKKPTVHILKNVSGHIKPGQLLAIMGSSGAGKTTLMNVLTRRNLSLLDVKGVVKLNGKPANVSDITALSAYVQQDDLFIGTLTVKEHLQFASQVRMGRNVSDKAREQRVQQILVELGLSKCADTMIGWPGTVKGISGGEMKRLAFGSELMTNPSLMFCDEPTSGLDSFMAQNVVAVLKDMAAMGRTIVCTIHQPSSEVFAMFDQLLLMADGRVAYLGPLDNSLEYFSNLGLRCPNNFNPADFYIKELAIIPGKENECKNKLKTICDQYVISSSAKDSTSDPIANGVKTDLYIEPIKRSIYRVGWIAQFRALMWRSFFSVMREPMITSVRCAQTVIIAIMLGFIFWRQDNDQNGVQNVNGALYLLLTNMTFSSAFAVMQTFSIELPIFLREHNNGMYRVDAYFLSKMIAELPTFIVTPFLFVVIYYFMVGLIPDVHAFFMCVFVAILVSNCACSCGYFISCISNSMNMALSLGPPILVPMLIFGGFFLNNETVPVYFIWFKYISWFYYGNELLMINQWKNVDHIDCIRKEVLVEPLIRERLHPNETDHYETILTGLQNFTIGATNFCLKDGQSVLKYLNFKESHFIQDILLLIAILIGFRIAAYVALFIKSLKR